MSEHYKPKGIPAFDHNSNRNLILVGTDEPRKDLHGWIVYQHPDGQWVTLRKATSDDTAAFARALSKAFHEG